METVFDLRGQVERERSYAEGSTWARGRPAALELARSFATLESEDRAFINDLISIRLGWILMGLSIDMAEAAMNERSQAMLDHAIVLHIIEDVRFDDRENIRRLVLIAKAAEYLDVDLKAIIADRLPIASARTRFVLDRFASRLDDPIHLERFEMRLVNIDGMLRFKALRR